MAAALEAAWPGPLEGLVVTRYGHRAPTRAIEVVEAAHPTPDAAGAAAAARILERVKGLSADDLVLCLISGGGSALLALPAPGPEPRRQAGDQSRAAEERRRHRRDELRAQASLGDQGRPAGGRRGAGAGRRPDHFRRAGRRSGDDRLRTDGARSDDLGRGAGDPPALCDRRAGARARPSRKRRGRDAEARRSALRQRDERRRRRAAPVARRRRRGGARGRRDAARSRRRDRGRSARSRQGVRRNRAFGGAARRAGARALRAALGRRNDGDGQRQGQGRAQRGIPARPGARRSTARRESGRSPATPTASTAARTTPARSSLPTRWRAPPRSASRRARGSTTTTPIRCSPRSATSSSPARR